MHDKPEAPPYPYQHASTPPSSYQHPSAPPYIQGSEQSYAYGPPGLHPPVLGTPYIHQLGSEPSYVQASSAPPYLHQPVSAQPLPPVSASAKTTIEPKHKKCLKRACRIVIGIVLLLMVALFLALFLFRRRAVEVTTSNVSPEKLSNSIQPLTLDLVLGVDITIKNQNFAGFNYKSSETKIFYHGVEVGTSPIPAGMIKARSTKNLHSTIYINQTAMVSSPSLSPEMIVGQIVLTTSTTLVGNGVVFNFIKIQATSKTSCDITVNFQTRTTDVDCKLDIHL